MEKSYSEKLKDPRWQRKRNGILERDNYTCQKCGDTKTLLHVHHKKYINGNDPWDCPDEYLITLCEFCHDILSKLKIDDSNFDKIKVITIHDESDSKNNPRTIRILTFKGGGTLIAIGNLNDYYFVLLSDKQISSIISLLQNK